MIGTFLADIGQKENIQNRVEQKEIGKEVDDFTGGC